MIRRALFFASFLLLPLFLSAQSANDYTKYVNPFIGTQHGATQSRDGTNGHLGPLLGL